MRWWLTPLFPRNSGQRLVWRNVVLVNIHLHQLVQEVWHPRPHRHTNRQWRTLIQRQVRVQRNLVDVMLKHLFEFAFQHISHIR